MPGLSGYMHGTACYAFDCTATFIAIWSTSFNPIDPKIDALNARASRRAARQQMIAARRATLPRPSDAMPSCHAGGSTTTQQERIAVTLCLGLAWRLRLWHTRPTVEAPPTLPSCGDGFRIPMPCPRPVSSRCRIRRMELQQHVSLSGSAAHTHLTACVRVQCARSWFRTASAAGRLSSQAAAAAAGSCCPCCCTASSR